MLIPQILKEANSNPKKLFLLDSLGAVLSAVLYMTILVPFEQTFGMPQEVVQVLAFLAIIYAVYSGICYWLNIANWQPFLKIIALANLTHCCLTVGLIFSYYESITVLGLLYFAGEFVIVTSLAIFELKTASKKNK